MTAENIKPGDTLVYDDGRPQHKGSEAVVLEVDDRGMMVQFANRASPNRISFRDREWMDHLTVKESK